MCASSRPSLLTPPRCVRLAYHTSRAGNGHRNLWRRGEAGCLPTRHTYHTLPTDYTGRPLIPRMEMSVSALTKLRTRASRGPGMRDISFQIWIRRRIRFAIAEDIYSAWGHPAAVPLNYCILRKPSRSRRRETVTTPRYTKRNWYFASLIQQGPSPG